VVEIQTDKVTNLDLVAIFAVPPSILKIPPPSGTFRTGFAARETVMAAWGHGVWDCWGWLSLQELLEGRA
jgi:hypothetical protein